MFEYSARDNGRTFFFLLGFPIARNQLLAETIITAEDFFFSKKKVTFELQEDINQDHGGI